MFDVPGAVQKLCGHWGLLGLDTQHPPRIILVPVPAPPAETRFILRILTRAGTEQSTALKGYLECRHCTC